MKTLEKVVGPARLERATYGLKGPDSTGVARCVLAAATVATTSRNPMVNHPRGAELRLHARFQADRIDGEWYRPSPALLAFIDGLREVAA